MLLASPAGLGVSTALVGVTIWLTFSVGSIGAIVGVAIASRVAKRIGVGPAIIGSMLIGGFGAIPYYLSGSLTASPLFTVYGLGVNWSMLSIMAGQFITFIGGVVYKVKQVSLRQAKDPLRLQRRMKATMRFPVSGTIPPSGLPRGFMGNLL